MNKYCAVYVLCYPSLYVMTVLTSSTMWYFVHVFTKNWLSVKNDTFQLVLEPVDSHSSVCIYICLYILSSNFVYCLKHAVALVRCKVWRVHEWWLTKARLSGVERVVYIYRSPTVWFGGLSSWLLAQSDTVFSTPWSISDDLYHICLCDWHPWMHLLLGNSFSSLSFKQIVC